jgi:hypothetical protein
MTCYENYPARYVVSNFAQLGAVALVGLMIMAQVGWWAAGLYGLFGGVGAILSMAWGCTRCHYYGRMCGLAFGRLAALGFEKRAETEFGRSPSQTLAWSLVGLALALPLVAGLILLSTSPTLSTVVLTPVYLVLVVVIALTHSRLVCGRCLMGKQGLCRLGRVTRPT